MFAKPLGVRRVTLALTGLAILLAVAPSAICPVAQCFQGAQGAEGVDFRRQIQPILSEHCAQCHGVDESTREGGLRLDLRESALAGGESAQGAIVPGKASESHLVRRILSKDPDEVMPPPSLNKPLSPEQVELLQRWIDQGAQYDKHWAFIPPVRTEVDLSKPIHGRKVRHTIDWLVTDTLHTKGWPSTGQAKAEYEKILEPMEKEICQKLRKEIFTEKLTPS